MLPVMDLKKLANKIADDVGIEYAEKIAAGDDVSTTITEAVKQAIYRYESAQTRDWAINGRW